MSHTTLLLHSDKLKRACAASCKARVPRLAAATLCGLLTAFSPLVLATLAPPLGDTFINSGAKNTNYGANNLLKVSPTQTTLVQFDLSTLPLGTVAADIQQATVILFVNAVPTGGSLTVVPVTSAWQEHSVTFNTEPAVGSPLITVPIPAANQYLVIDVTSQVQSWVANPGSDFGLELIAVATLSPECTAVLNWS